MWQELFANNNWLVPSLLGLFSFVVYLIWYRRDSREPPGPIPLPILGNYLSIDRNSLDKTLEKWRIQHGDVYTVHLGSRKVVVVCGYENIRDILTKSHDVFHDRIKGFPVPFASKGVVMSNRIRWQETRRFTLQFMKEMGLGHQSFQDNVIQEALVLCSLLESHPTKVLNLKPMLSNSASNIICSMLFGHRFKFDDHDFLCVTRLSNIIMATENSETLLFFPWITSIPIPGLTQPMGMRRARSDFNALVTREIVNHKEKYVSDGRNVKDLIDLYLKIKIEDSDFEKRFFDDDSIRQIILDLFVAGTETTSAVMLWAILHLTLNPDAQDRCHKEICKVLPHDAIPQLSHQSQMPYIEAVLAETLRIGDIAPFGLFRAAIHDYKFHDHLIKKGMPILPFFHSVHYDPNQWPEPDRFKPERWLNKDGKFIHHQQLVPFSLGPRNCLGEHVARTELFLFFTVLFQRFRFEIPPNRPPPSTAARAAHTRMPHPFEVQVTRV